MERQKKDFAEKYSERLSNIFTQELSWGKTKESYIEVIKSVYTAAELKKLIAFYETDLGRIYIKKQQIEMQLLAESSQQLIENIQRRIQELDLEKK